MTVLYVTQAGASVHHTQGRLRVSVGKTVLHEARLADVERVVIVGGTAGVTSAAAVCLMEAGIETAYLSSSGSFRGWLSPARGKGVLLRLAQGEAYRNETRRLGLARAIVAQKIHNGDALLARFARNHADFEPQSERARMNRALQSARNAASVDSLLGHEGDAAAAYFGAFGRMLRHGFSFTTRSRRPPLDPANALLSLGYTLLTAEATGAVAGAGLDPSLGMLHAPHEGRPSLGLDLVEEFRQAVVDRTVLHLVNNRVLSPTDDFEKKGGSPGTLLNAQGRKAFFVAYEKRMSEPFAEREGGPQTCLRACVRRQAHTLARALQNGTDYRPFVLR